MLAIKLKRIGKKRQASFRVVVMEKRSKLQGRFVEDLGWANPRTDEQKVNAERATHWLKVGAQPTDTAWNLLVKTGVVRGKKIAVHGKSKQKVEAAKAEAAPAAVAAPAPETPASETPPASADASADKLAA
ncbi:MAG: 30S ribosomal protein S16 [Candidatus Brennerbacteria bacterium]